MNYRGIFWDDKRKDSLYLSSVALTRWIGWDRKAPPNWSDNNVLGHKLWVMTAATAANSYTLLGSSSYCKIMPVIPVWIFSTVIKDPSLVHLDFYLTFYVTMFCPLPLKLLARGVPRCVGGSVGLVSQGSVSQSLAPATWKICYSGWKFMDSHKIIIKMCGWDDKACLKPNCFKKQHSSSSLLLT